MTFADLIAMLQMASQMPIFQNVGGNETVLPPEYQGREYRVPENYAFPQPGLRTQPPPQEYWLDRPGMNQIQEQDLIDMILRKRMYQENPYQSGVMRRL